MNLEKQLIFSASMKTLYFSVNSVASVASVAELGAFSGCA
jgi:hypothetical protein